MITQLVTKLTLFIIKSQMLFLEKSCAFWESGTWSVGEIDRENKRVRFEQ